jgi:hypothetical protein
MLEHQCCTETVLALVWRLRPLGHLAVLKFGGCAVILPLGVFFQCRAFLGAVIVLGASLKSLTCDCASAG